jgi:hypothetical protein
MIRRVATSFAASVAAVLVAAAPATAEEPGKSEFNPKLTRCRMAYNLKGWSFVYKTSKGDGRIDCDNGQSAEVTIKSWGGGFTVGKSEIIGGQGSFSGVRDIKDLFGSFAQAEAHAGATKSAGAGALTKGEVSLALAGTGQGIDVGVSFGRFDIQPK